MAKLHIESETFKAYTPYDPLSKRAGTFLSGIRFVEVPDTLDDILRAKEDALWQEKVKDAKAKGQVLTRGFQFLVKPSDIDPLKYAPDEGIVLPVARGTYSRIELAKAVVKDDASKRDIPNVLALCEIVKGSNGYIFVERGGSVAYHGGKSQLHALVAGNYPRNLQPPIRAEDFTPEAWLEAQQQTEHDIKPKEILRQFLGIILDKTLGYKPDIAFTAITRLTADDISKRIAQDAWEKKGIREVPATPEALIRLIAEHSDLKRHVPPGYGAAILELARRGTVKALDKLNSELKTHGAPVVTYWGK